MRLLCNSMAIIVSLASIPCFAAPNIILVSGGPSIYNPKDPALHDKSWDNFVTSPGLMFNAKLLPSSSDRHEVWWFVYKPAYEARWTDDRMAKDFRLEHTKKVLEKYSSYVDLIEKKAAERKWTLRWIVSAQDFWSKLATFKDPINEIHYWGHASHDLWLTCSHNALNQASPPKDNGAIIAVSDIAANSMLKDRFAAGARNACNFWGCNTAQFAEKWHATMATTTIGFDGAITFVHIHDDKGVPRLVSGATKKEFKFSN